MLSRVRPALLESSFRDRACRIQRGASSGSDLGPSNPALIEAVEGRVNVLWSADPGNTAPIPVDLVTTSGSGLDPHISVAAAQYQAARVARARHLDEASVEG